MTVMHNLFPFKVNLKSQVTIYGCSQVENILFSENSEGLSKQRVHCWD